MPASSPNTSATGGFLAPSTPAPIDDVELDRWLQGLVAGITGLPGTSVRPRYQPEEAITDVQPRNPNVNVNWCAVGVMGEEQDATPALIHNGDDNGSTTLVRHMTLDVLASFYGPRSASLAELFRDGLYVPQNRESLFLNGMGLIDVGTAHRVPDIVNTSVRRRTDLGFRLRRRVERTYPILNVVEVQGTVHADAGSVHGPAAHDVPFDVKE